MQHSIPDIKSQSSYSSEVIFDKASSYSMTWTKKKDQVDSHDESEQEPGVSLVESEPRLKLESFYQEVDEDRDVSLDELSDDDDGLSMQGKNLRRLKGFQI